jgi:glutathione-specific gamma-glutamylcyclotransferase
VTTAETAAEPPPDLSNLWVFAYGSLIWRPGFDFAERQLARLDGFRRCFSMTSIHYRGTPEVPGLVLSLDSDSTGRCDGIAYRVEEASAPAVLDYLRERELISYAYVERQVQVSLSDGRIVPALAYVSNPGHPQYCGGLDLAEQAAMIARASGSMGANADYLRSTVASLETLGLHDPDLGALLALLPAP